MLLVVAIVGGAVFTTVQNSSQIQSTSGLANADVQVEEFGVTDNGLETEIRAASADQVEDVNISLIDDETGETVYSSEEVSMPVGGTETVSFPDVGNSENTNTYQVQVTYDTGGLNNLTVEGALTGRISINGTVPESQDDTDQVSSDAVQVSGGSITAMATSSTFLNSSGVICVGPECSETSGSETGEYVSRSGDEMTGTLFVDNITDLNTMCFGEICDVEIGSNKGLLGEDGNEVDGSLNITELKPDSASQICAGTKC
jgi:hypothetical protein